MKAFSKNKANKHIKMKQSKNTYIKKLSISLSCLFLLISAILLTFAKFETSSGEFTLIEGVVSYAVCAYEDGTEWNFSYTGNIQEFEIPCSGEYKLEVWGAQGGNYTSGNGAAGGKGGYSYGNTTLSRDNSLFIVVGGQGKSPVTGNNYAVGGYNGGGNGSNLLTYSTQNWLIGGGSGGGATHIASENLGVLKDFSGDTDKILIVAGGGGGGGANSGSAANQYNVGGAGGGSTAGSGTNVKLSGYSAVVPGQGASQTGVACSYSSTSKHCGSFGQGGSNEYLDAACQAAGGGGGYYGGSSGMYYGSSGGGGSGWTGTLTNANTIVGTSTITEPSGSSATGHAGNGYARITLVSSSDRFSLEAMCNNIKGKTWKYQYTGNVQEFEAPCDGEYKLEVWGAQGGSYTLGSGAAGGKGGYSYGNTTLSREDSLFIVVGGQGKSPATGDNYALGGYNGGGDGSNIQSWSDYNWTVGGAGGGGATHIASQNLGELGNYAESIDKLLIVAGGGGGGGANSGSAAQQYNVGGAGGGTSGANGKATMISGYSSITAGEAGTQSGPGCESAVIRCGAFGIGGHNRKTSAAAQTAGGGAGYYGGASGRNYGASGGGGSGWTGTLTSANTIVGTSTITEPSGSTATGHAGNGYAKITYIG